MGNSILDLHRGAVDLLLSMISEVKAYKYKPHLELPRLLQLAIHLDLYSIQLQHCMRAG